MIVLLIYGKKMNKIEERKNKLVGCLEQKGKLSVAEVADLFRISLPTARRLCAQLEQERKAMRTHGGIRFIPEIKVSYTFDTIDAEHNAEKEAIARYACGMVKNNGIVFLDAGTTVKHLALALADRIRNGQLSGISVFTNSLVNLEILEPVCKVTVIGGLYRKERRDFCGFLAEKMLRTLRFNICFIGADALNLADGIMAMDIETVRLDELLIGRSDQSICLVHSEKFQKFSLISICAVRDVSSIVTDKKIDPAILREYQAAGVNILPV
jgi:DeoR/GlpR family transcriptional regulator of sugar metabolism